MKYYLKELCVNETLSNTGGQKARDDFECIFEQLGFQMLPVRYGDLDRMDKLSRQMNIFTSLKASLSTLKPGDILIIQHPFLKSSILACPMLSQLHEKNIRYIILLHDLESIRHNRRVSTSWARRLKTSVIEVTSLKNASRIILLNPRMVESLANKGVGRDKLIEMDVFDYLIPDYDKQRRKGKLGKDKPVIIAGNLLPYKASFAYKLPENCSFNLYGVGFTGQLNPGSRYFGAFPPDDLPHVMRGSFGLVWDGESCETCSGIFGEYLRFNCPHKIALYLACGIPVAIWRQAAKAEFIVQNKLGIAVDSLSELRETIDRLSERDYAEMVRNAEQIGEQIRAGYYTRRAIRDCLESMGDSEAVAYHSPKGGGIPHEKGLLLP